MKYLIILCLIGVCIASLPNFKGDLDKTTPKECDFCIYATSVMENMIIHNNKSVTEIKQELEKLCKFVSPNLKSTCDSIIEVYTIQIIQLIFSKENPSEICKQIHICSNESSFKTVISIIKEEFRIPELPTKEKKFEGNQQKCYMCKLFVTKIQEFISQNKTEGEIMKELETACSYMNKYQQQCDQLVQEYVPSIIAMMNSTENPEKVCEQIQLCPASLSNNNENNYINNYEIVDYNKKKLIKNNY